MTKFNCTPCQFNTSKQSHWRRHASTHKHKINTNNDYAVQHRNNLKQKRNARMREYYKHHRNYCSDRYNDHSTLDYICVHVCGFYSTHSQKNLDIHLKTDAHQFWMDEQKNHPSHD